MVQVIIVGDAYGEHVVAESHICGGNGRDGGAVGENNIYRGVWGRGEKRRRDIRRAIKIIACSTVEPWVRIAGRRTVMLATSRSSKVVRVRF